MSVLGDPRQDCPAAAVRLAPGGSSTAGRFPNRAAFEADLAVRIRSQVQAYAGCLPRLASAAAR